jgi:hypothetical protein
MTHPTHRITALLDADDAAPSPPPPPSHTEPATGLFAFRFHDCCPALGRWVVEDPVGFVGGGTTYEFLPGDADATSDAT